MNNTTSLPSNGYNLVQAAKQPIFYSYFVTMTFITITSILNATVLCRRALRSSSCTYYFLASVPSALVYMIVTSVNGILTYAFGLSFYGTAVTCKICFFLVTSMPLFYGLMLVCASIDRFCLSSTSVRFRHLSQVRVARRIIIIVWILTFTYISPYMAIFYYDYNSNTCSQYSTTLISVYLMTRVIVYYFLIPISLGIFGSLTIYNIRSQTRRVAPVNQVNLHRRTEGQLARMLIIQVAMYFLFFTPSGITYILVTFVPSMNTPYFITIRSLASIWQQGGFFMSFFLYILSGKIYREELKKIFRWNQNHNQSAQLRVRSTLRTLPVTALPTFRT